jgi:hypothetical protein
MAGTVGNTLTLRVQGTPSRGSGGKCVFVIRAAVVGGGFQTTCIRASDGLPGSKVTMHSTGWMSFFLPRGSIRAKVLITQHYAADGAHAHQTLRGSITAGTGQYREARGAITGTGTVDERRDGLGRVNLRYVLTLR